MDATRPHLSFPAEWITASIFLLATFAVGSLIVSELRVPPAPMASPVDASRSNPAQPAVPTDAVSVPRLALGEGAEISVGEPASLADGKLAAATLANRTSEPGPLGLRDIRSYELAGTKFIIVTEPFERRGEPRVAAIYLR